MFCYNMFYFLVIHNNNCTVTDIKTSFFSHYFESALYMKSINMYV